MCVYLGQQIKPEGGVSVFTPPLCLKTITFLQCNSFGAHTVWLTRFPVFLCLPTPATLLESSHCRGRTLPCHALPYYTEWHWSPFQIHHPLPQPHCFSCHCHSLTQPLSPLAVYLFFSLSEIINPLIPSSFSWSIIPKTASSPFQSILNCSLIHTLLALLSFFCLSNLCIMCYSPSLFSFLLW